MFEQAFKNIDDVLWKDAGCTSELDYTEQSSWLLFLKYLDSLEADKGTEAELDGKKYTHILDAPYRWESWAAPKDKAGKLDHDRALGGDDLRDFVNQKLFPYLHGFKAKATGSYTIEYKIGEIFGEIKNRIQSGYNLRDIIDHNDADLAEFIALQKTKADSPKSWSVNVAAIDPKTFDLSVKNPNGGEEITHRSPQEIMEEIASLDAESAEVLNDIRKLL